MKGLVQHVETFFKKNGSTILTCLGAAGVVATMATTVKATIKAHEAITLEEVDRGTHYVYDRIAKKHYKKDLGKLSTKERIKIAAPHFIVPGMFALGTIACIFGANVVNKKAQAALMSAYALLDESYKQYKDHANEVYGEDADRKIKLAMAEGTYEDGELKTINESGQMVYLDFNSMLTFHATPALISKAEEEVNNILAVNGKVYYYQWLEALGLPTIEDDYITGWTAEFIEASGYERLEFETVEEIGANGEPYCVVFPKLEPNYWMY